jgi:hypothetical protein
MPNESGQGAEGRRPLRTWHDKCVCPSPCEPHGTLVCTTCGATDPKENVYCSNGFHALKEDSSRSYWSDPVRRGEVEEAKPGEFLEENVWANHKEHNKGFVSTPDRWEVCSVASSKGKKLERLLNDGWEPFAVNGHDGGEFVWLKRKRKDS